LTTHYALQALRGSEYSTSGRLSHLKEPGTPLWGESVWGKGKEEWGTGNYVLTAYSLRGQPAKVPEGEKWPEVRRIPYLPSPTIYTELPRTPLWRSSRRRESPHSPAPMALGRPIHARGGRCYLRLYADASIWMLPARPLLVHPHPTPGLYQRRLYRRVRIL
jgi:hypothetical protein